VPDWTSLIIPYFFDEFEEFKGSKNGRDELLLIRLQIDQQRAVNNPTVWATFLGQTLSGGAVPGLKALG
jgi:hypothetical protein